MTPNSKILEDFVKQFILLTENVSVVDKPLTTKGKTPDFSYQTPEMAEPWIVEVKEGLSYNKLKEIKIKYENAKLTNPGKTGGLVIVALGNVDRHLVSQQLRKSSGTGRYPVLVFTREMLLKNLSSIIRSAVSTPAMKQKAGEMLKKFETLPINARQKEAQRGERTFFTNKRSQGRRLG